jgi:hypothetical protein
MKSIEDILRMGGTIEVPRGFLKSSYELSGLGETVARLAWEEAPPGKAYFDTASERYEVDSVVRSHLTRRRTIQARRGGEVVAELHAGWRGSDGEAITSAGHRYVFGKARGCYVLEHEVGHERVCEVSRRRLGHGREIRVAAGQPAEDVVGVLAALIFHILAIDYASDRRALASGGFAAGG